MSRTRFSVASAKGQENLAILAQAITTMKQLEPTNPLSWEYQAALHGTNNPALVNAPFVNGCPHYNQAGADTGKFFLVWHRLALYHFEEAIRSISGRQDFTLPYWDVTDPNQRTIPKAFLSVDNGGLPGLYDPDRGKTLTDPTKPVLNLNDGKTILPSSERYDPALKELSQVANSGYELFNQAIDHAPHGGPHIDINGKMLDFKTAALEPLFWVHHCNIDRLWAEYSKDAVDPQQFSKLTPGMTFGFFDQKGQPVTYSYEAAAKAIYNLDYDYDTGANTLKPASGPGSSKTTQPIHNKSFNQKLSSLSGKKLTLQRSPALFRPWTLPGSSNNRSSSRTILGVTLKSCHSTTGHIDILIGGPNEPNFDAVTNIPFKQLKQRDQGNFLDQHFAGTVNLLAHTNDPSMAMPNSRTNFRWLSTLNPKACEDMQSYLFDITDELAASNTSATAPLSISFNIDPEQNNPGALNNVILSSLSVYNLV